MKTSISTADLVNGVMDRFDFNNVHKAMVALDWQWTRCGGVPEPLDLRKQARAMLTDVAARKGDLNGWYTSTGGFVAYWEDDYLVLEFVVEAVGVDMKGVASDV